MGIDLPLLWMIIIGFGLMMYVIMDGFDLGIGILFPFVPDRADRDIMVNTVAPVWDGNETWLVLGGAALLAAFPLAYSVILSALYLPIKTEFTVVAETDCEIALCFSRAEEKFPARLIKPSEVEVEIRGGANATRQINHILKPEFPAQRLLLVEVYTPSGNWSSYPPHKHDVHSPPDEVDLEELYYYKIDRPEGYAIQRVYTPDGRIDQTLTVRDGELVLIPEGYHPVVAAHGYNVYYLNALAGSARSMAASDDPAYAWVRQSWTEQDQRVPLVAENIGHKGR